MRFYLDGENNSNGYCEEMELDRRKELFRKVEDGAIWNRLRKTVVQGLIDAQNTCMNKAPKN